MVLDEALRHRLHARLEGVLGPDEASALMSYLPPAGWADVATKRDLDGLEERMGLRFESLEERMGLRFEALEERMKERHEALEERMSQRYHGLDERMSQRYDGLEERMGLRFEASEARVEAAFSNVAAELRGEITTAVVSQTRATVFAMVGTMVGAGSLVLAAARFA